MKNIRKSCKRVSIILFVVFGIVACDKKKYNSAYAKIDSPSDNSIFNANDTLVFRLSSKKSGVAFEFDKCLFKLYNVNTGQELINRDVQDTIQFIPHVSDTTVFLASAEYWREDSKVADKVHQIHQKVLP